MIVEIDKNDSNLIEKLEISFNNYFNKNRINEDLKNNIFSKYCIYKDNNNIIGFINYYDLYDRFEIAYIEVKEEYRNRLIGSKLLNFLIEKGMNKNINNITLEVNINNINAIKLYTKFNFKVVTKRKGYYDGIDAYLMERKMM